MLGRDQFWPEKAAAGAEMGDEEGIGIAAKGRESILPETTEMLARLPIDAYPYWTLRRFPHTLNAIARRAKNQQEIVRAIDGLLLCDRPHRQGFPIEVFLELLEIAHAHGSRGDSRPASGFYGYNVRFDGGDVLMRAAFSRAGRMPRRMPPCRARDRHPEPAAAAPHQPAQRHTGD